MVFSAWAFCSWSGCKANSCPAVYVLLFLFCCTDIDVLRFTLYPLLLPCDLMAGGVLQLMAHCTWLSSTCAIQQQAPV